MGGRRWTNEELALLDELATQVPNANIARRLGRSQHSVRVMLSRRGVTAYPSGSENMTMHQVEMLTGISHRTLKKKWKQKGFHFQKRGIFLMVTQRELLAYMRKHPEDWNATRITDDTLFRRFDWYKQKKAADLGKAGPRTRAWSQAEINTLKIRYRQGRSMKEISAELGRSESGVKNKLFAMRKNGYKL